MKNYKSLHFVVIFMALLLTSCSKDPDLKPTAKSIEVMLTPNKTVFTPGEKITIAVKTDTGKEVAPTDYKVFISGYEPPKPYKAPDKEGDFTIKVSYRGLDKEIKVKAKTIYISDRGSNLNVFYFIPSDRKPLEGYQKRISEVMLYTQKWYKKEMNRNGFGEKTFGLLVDKNNDKSVKIIIVKGKHNASYYPYLTGGQKVKNEISDYLVKNRIIDVSSHNVVFMPGSETTHTHREDLPFYGIGKRCFVIDYQELLDSRKLNGEKYLINIAATMHEIGHCLNLPHNSGKASDDFTSIMGTGTIYFSRDPDKVHLTKASAVILNNNQVFSKQPYFTFYDQEPSNTIKSLRIFADYTNLYLRCKFNSSIPVNAAIVYNDPLTTRFSIGKNSFGEVNNQDYDAITWATTKIINNDSISLVMPLTGIYQKYKYSPFNLRIRFCHTNGTSSYKNGTSPYKKLKGFRYEYKKGKPDININITP